MSFAVELTKDGIVAHHHREKELVVPAGVFGLLRFWHCTLAGIDPDSDAGALSLLCVARRREG